MDEFKWSESLYSKVEIKHQKIDQVKVPEFCCKVYYVCVQGGIVPTFHLGHKQWHGPNLKKSAYQYKSDLWMLLLG